MPDAGCARDPGDGCVGAPRGRSIPPHVDPAPQRYGPVGASHSVGWSRRWSRSAVAFSSCGWRGALAWRSLSRGFAWCGLLSAPQQLIWSQVQRILPAPAGSDSRIAAIAVLADGSVREVRALWESPTSVSAVLGMSDHSRAYATLVQAHQQVLGQRA